MLTNPIVEEYDASNGWHVVKYANGNAECWGSIPYNYGTGKAWAGGYYHPVAAPIPLPITFSSAPILWVTQVGGQVGHFENTLCTTTHISQFTYYNAVSSSSGTTQLANIIVKGRWK